MRRRLQAEEREDEPIQHRMPYDEAPTPVPDDVLLAQLAREGWVDHAKED